MPRRQATRKNQLSGVCALVGDNPNAKYILRAAAAAAPGRGQIRAEWYGEHGALSYQGSNAQRAFFSSDRFVCVVLGWPYEIDERSQVARQLDAAEIVAKFAVSRDLDARKIHGQYVATIFCIQSSSLFVVRDVHNSLPLHWSALVHGSVHASDIRQIAAAKSEPLTLSVAALTHYHQQLALPAKMNLYSGIHLHAPGTTSKFTANQVGIQGIRPAPEFGELFSKFCCVQTPQHAVDEVIGAVTQSLTFCLRNERAALSLSGGMDSALLLMCGNSQPLKSFACTFPEKKCDEAARIHAIVDANFQISNPQRERQHQDIVFQNPDFSVWQNALFSATDYVPFSANQIGLQVANVAAQSGCTLLLDGNGGDEIFDWSMFELAQTACSFRDYIELIRMLISRQPGEKKRALRHLLKRMVYGQVAQPLTQRSELYGKMLNPSTGRAFYLASEQITNHAGVKLYSPMRDLALLQRLCPWMPAGSFRGGVRRGLQAEAIFQLSGDSIRLNRADKVNFDEFAQVPMSPRSANLAQHLSLPNLGAGKLENFAGLMPRFLEHKVQIEGVLLGK
jgi:asparagine synthetase B (glutamine-hydrolysing)